jgi:predicted nucleic-acid-binding protein
MRAVDTNVLVRLLARDDLKQAAAVEAFIAPGAWVSVLALAEAIWVLGSAYKVSAAGLGDGIEKLLNHRHLLIQDFDAVAEALRVFRSKPSLGFTDCLMLQLARKAGHLPLGTFDRKLSLVDGTQRI